MFGASRDGRDEANSDDSDPCRSKGKVVKVLHYLVHQNLNFISTHNYKIETHIAKFCTTGACSKTIST